jgi:aldose 1-epimerase
MSIDEIRVNNHDESEGEMKQFQSISIGTAAIFMMMGAAHASVALRMSAGKLRDGTPVEAVVLKNAAGVSAKILTYGATLQSLIAPDRHGVPADIVLGYDNVSGYELNQTFLGATIGRYANRIANGRFSIDGQWYQLPLNNGTNTLHGGGKGFDRSIWAIQWVSNGPKASVRMNLSSPDGASGYPGEVNEFVTYALDERDALTITFDATTSKSTILNMTNHALFNMAGEGAPEGAMANRLTIPAKAYTPVDESLIPTGELHPVKDTVFDFTKGRILASGLRDGNDVQIRVGRGYYHNFAINNRLTQEQKLLARLEDPVSGRVLEVLSTQPGLQLYTGNFIDGTLLGKHGHVYRMGDGIALEPQKFPDAPKHPEFDSARVDPGTPYHHAMTYRVSVAK